jgi:hypothetical protein
VKIKNLALVAAAAFGLVGAPATFACSIAAWNGGPTTPPPVAGRPSDASPVARYSGQCGLRAAATGQFVTDNTPGAEQTFRARFYVYTGLSAGAAVVYEALNAATPPASMIRVSYDRAGNQFTFNTSGGAGSITGIVQDRWYSVELNWNRATSNMAVSVAGAGSETAQTATVTGVAAGDQIDTARLGWVSGGGTAAARSITVDAYESRRNTAIGRLCRGDANNDRTLNVGDRGTVTTEVLSGTTLGAGQPDCNEDGVVNVGDRGCITTRVLAGDSCPAP